MKKPVWISFIILCLLSISSLINCEISVKASPRTWTVAGDGSADFRTIQEAINNESVAAGDTIFVRNGTYYENVAVNKSVSLVGEDRDSTIVDGMDTNSVISIMANNVSITGFTIRKSGMDPSDSAVHVEVFSGNVIRGNKIVSNNNGISFYSSSDNVVSGNTIINNTFEGIYLYSSGSSLISGNIITDNYHGIYLLSYVSSLISGNMIINNNNGISFYSSSDNVVLGNTIINSTHEGIILALSSGNNTIYHNNFRNAVQLRSDPRTPNVWDYGGEGNYWSDFNGTDFYSGPFQNETGSDGIGDEPYVIDANNRDNHPLMGVLSDFNVTLKAETYHVTVVCNSTISNFRFEIGAETGNKIIRFNVTGQDGKAGFCRVTIPTELMNYPFIVLVDEEEIIPTLLKVSNEMRSYLYFTCINGSHTIAMISSKALVLYNELLTNYTRLQTDLYNLNATYYDLLNNYTILLGNYTQLQDIYRELNTSYQEHLMRYSEQVQNIQSLMYIFAALSGIFMITTVYLSKRAHTRGTTKTKVFEDEK